MRLVPASHDVRSTPKTDIGFQRNICSDGPQPDSCSAAKRPLFDPLVGDRAPHRHSWRLQRKDRPHARCLVERVQREIFERAEGPRVR